MFLNIVLRVAFGIVLSSNGYQDCNFLFKNNGKIRGGLLKHRYFMADQSNMAVGET